MSKEFTTRIALKYDNYANWMASDLILEAGEIAFCQMPVNTNNLILPSDNSSLTTVMYKVGNGSNKFADLNWGLASAGDVYAWAKASVRPSYSYGDSDLTGFGDAATKDITYFATAEALNNLTASDIKFIPGETGMTSTTVQDAIVEAYNHGSSSEAAIYNMVKDASSGDYVAVYHLTKQIVGSEEIINIGDPINIPKDFLVKDAEVKVCTEQDKPIPGLNVGDKYIDFTINAQEGTVTTEKHIYLAVKDLVDVYSVKDTDEIAMSMSSNNVITSTLKSVPISKIEQGETTILFKCGGAN